MISRKPTHPGEIFREEVMKPLNLSVDKAASLLDVSSKDLSEFIHEEVSLSPKLAINIARATNTTPESWMNLQVKLDLWQAYQSDSGSSMTAGCMAADDTQKLLDKAAEGEEDTIPEIHFYPEEKGDNDRDVCEKSVGAEYFPSEITSPKIPPNSEERSLIARDDVTAVKEANMDCLNQEQVWAYVQRMEEERGGVMNIPEDKILRMLHIEKDGVPTLAGLLVFGYNPQFIFPQLYIQCRVIRGIIKWEENGNKDRLLDCRKVTGPLGDVVTQAVNFAAANLRTESLIDGNTGQRQDIPELPLDAVREAVLNAVIHRDYSQASRSQPVFLDIYSDRLEVTSPGGIFGINGISHFNPSGNSPLPLRNPVLADFMETLHLSENRYTGIPCICRQMKMHKLPEPEFFESQGNFKVIFRRKKS